MLPDRQRKKQTETRAYSCKATVPRAMLLTSSSTQSCEKYKLWYASQSDLLNPRLQQWRQTGAMLSLWLLKRTKLWVHSLEIGLKTWT